MDIYILDFFALNAIYIIKILAAVLLLFYIAFTLVVFQQARLMNKVIDAGVSSIISLIAFSHFAFSLLVFLWVIFFL